MKRKIFYIIAAVLAALMLFSACDGDSPSEVEVTEGTEVQSEPTTEAPETEAATPKEMFLFEDGLCIVRPHNAGETLKLACEVVADAISNKYGFEVKVISERESISGAEIVVGLCSSRPESYEFCEAVKEKGCGYSVNSQAQILISGINSDKILIAACLFADRVLAEGVEIGSVVMSSEESVDFSYRLCGVDLEKYKIVADAGDAEAAEYLRASVKESLGVSLEVVTPDKFGGGHAIVICDGGTYGYGGIRYKLSHESVGGISTIYIHGDSKELRAKAVKTFFEEYINTNKSMALLKIPDSIYRYAWPEQYLTTGFSFGEIVEHIEMAPGVDYYGMKYSNADGKNVDVYVTVVSGKSEARFAAWAGDLSTIDDGKEVMDVKTVTQQAMLLERESGMRVLAASNGAFFQKSFGTNYPYTMRIIQGRMLCPPRLTPYPTRPANWIGVTYDGQVVTGNHDSYYAEWDGKLEYAVACGYHMLLDGKFNVQGVGNINPLTAVATTADGGFVLACADGRTDKSAGGTNIDMLGIFLDLEAIYPDIEFVDAYILDEGGSTEMVLDNPNGHTFITKNNPSDGKSRPIGDIIAVVIPK